MTDERRREQASAFLALHHGPEPLVIPNVWDGGSARIMEQAGFPALATTSAGIAFSHGVPDGALDRRAMTARIAQIVAATDVPVTADLESGYGPDPDDVAESVAEAVAIGVVGVNLEDILPGAPTLLDAARAAERIGVARRIAPKGTFVLNARTDTYLAGTPDPFAETLRRAERYIDAGADCIFVPGVDDLDTIAALADRIPAPLNIVAGLTGASRTVAELSRAGVARITIGGSLARAALATIETAARDMYDRGTFPFAATALSHADVQQRFNRPRVQG
ncbi:isocitrate lyase/PEP mutase family protein [Thermomonospora umbrina]|uniref:2-methylisocitrate lyase-like PEP mutase family enzyme n=1 Tax=Thermomonospora umbrina TaxID=111806 RepID=A0A3D9SFR9_9ACTN|nr:isocitrate lyase/phosphoenolpyruvate mutase family protein [Thermomonospora umbrina]REE94756.1 2-methylisocitrate lyase-like PEP mutase family enzyme [Thermomonospora umbrina]